MEKEQSSMGTKLWMIREALNMSKQQMAGALGVSDINWEEYESGANIPALSVLLTIKRQYLISLDCLLDDRNQLFDFYESQIRANLMIITKRFRFDEASGKSRQKYLELTDRYEQLIVNG